MGWNEGARSYISNSTRYVSSTPITGRHAHKAARHGLFSGGTVSMRLTFFDLFDLFDTAWPAATWTATPAGGDNQPRANFAARRYAEAVRDPDSGWSKWGWRMRKEGGEERRAEGLRQAATAAECVM